MTFVKFKEFKVAEYCVVEWKSSFGRWFRLDTLLVLDMKVLSELQKPGKSVLQLQHQLYYMTLCAVQTGW